MSPQHVVTRASRPAPRRRWADLGPDETPEPATQTEAPVEPVEQGGRISNTPEVLGHSDVTTPLRPTPGPALYDLPAWARISHVTAPDEAAFRLPDTFTIAAASPPEGCPACDGEHPVEKAPVGGGFTAFICPNLPPDKIIVSDGRPFHGRL